MRYTTKVEITDVSHLLAENVHMPTWFTNALPGLKVGAEIASYQKEDRGADLIFITMEQMINALWSSGEPRCHAWITYKREGDKFTWPEVFSFSPHQCTEIEPRVPIKEIVAT